MYCKSLNYNYGEPQWVVIVKLLANTISIHTGGATIENMVNVV